MAKRTKPEQKKIGRPKLPNGAVKGRVVQVRFKDEELARISTAASLSNQNLSEWIRSTLNAATS